MKYAIYAAIAIAVIYNVLTGDMGESLGISIPSVDGIWTSLGSLI